MVNFIEKFSSGELYWEVVGWVGRSLAGRFMERHFLLHELAPVWGQCGVLDLGNCAIMIRSSCKFFLFTLFLYLRVLKENIMIRSCKLGYSFICEFKKKTLWQDHANSLLLFANSKRKHCDKIMQILFFYLRIQKESIMIRSCMFSAFTCEL